MVRMLASFLFSLNVLLFFRWPSTSGVTAPLGAASAADDSLYVAGAEETRCHELLERGRVCLFGNRHGPRAADVQAQDTAEPGVKSQGEYEWRS